ncbi:hypothetical protein [Lactiplantibacillus xiangfangensis]|uniref:Uncharacterized protein n=1 Tax=Lactiplantibacillus xiangfangensis TaxID=942150 RepID=A0A0R2M7V0_9LACO|nr:hypothetical protein [Lactiplantibacillus xiangfangensis]KRO08048.1 hypothetical protein IV64_GL000897 [Lactiplantibacillus xiangfangensis]
MKWKSIWRHTRYILETLVIYFFLIQGPYDLWLGKTGYHLWSYVINTVGIAALFLVVEIIYNYVRQQILKRRRHQ